MKQLVEQIKKIKIDNFDISDGSQQRTIGDLIEYKLNQQIKKICSELAPKKYEFDDKVGKKSTGDCVITIDKNVTLLIDCKTHNADSKMSMPNLISMKKLITLLETDDIDLVYVFCNYKIKNNTVSDIKITVQNLHHLNEEYLGIGNLGNGQLQIKNLNNIRSLEGTTLSKEEFYKKMIQKHLNFLDAQIQKNIKTKLIYQTKLKELNEHNM